MQPERWVDYASHAGAVLEKARSVNLLLANKADVEQRLSIQFRTPLIVAVCECNAAVVSRLLKHGADPNAAYVGNAPGGFMEMAIFDTTPEIVELLLKHGFRIEPELLAGCIERVRKCYDQREYSLPHEWHFQQKMATEVKIKMMQDACNNNL